MSVQERAHWDAYYRKRAAEPYPAPEPMLFEFVPPLFEEREHRALDIAAGLGHNALWLAEQGYIVDALDISRVALQAAHTEAARRGLRDLNLLPLDLDSAMLKMAAYDVVIVINFFKRDLVSQLRGCVRPGGRVRLNASTEASDDAALREGELAGYFADWRILLNTRLQTSSQLVAVKPA